MDKVSWNCPAFSLSIYEGTHIKQLKLFNCYTYSYISIKGGTFVLSSLEINNVHINISIKTAFGTTLGNIDIPLNKLDNFIAAEALAKFVNKRRTTKCNYAKLQKLPNISLFLLTYLLVTSGSKNR